MTLSGNSHISAARAGDKMGNHDSKFRIQPA
jgi:hypothetical protein